LTNTPQKTPLPTPTATSFSEQLPEEDHPMTLIQFLMYLYHNVADFRTLCMSGEFITALVATLFPYPQPDFSSDVTTPNEEFKVQIKHQYGDYMCGHLVI
jgi:hypothetical protein